MSNTADATLSSKTISDWLRNSSFVFSGHITEIGKNNLDGVQLDERMVLVNVDDVVMSPRILGEISGKSVTVSLQSLEGIEQGKMMTFFANPFYLGSNIGLSEVGRTSSSAAEIREVTINTRMAQLDEELKERINGAHLVISGRVLTTKPYPNNSFPGADDIEWWTAQIRVETIEKGQLPSDDLWIYFPTGGDPRWGLYPKFYTGQEGVWFLRSITQIQDKDNNSNKTQLQSNDNVKFLVAERSADFHAISDLARIQLLLLQGVKIVG